MSQQVVLYPQNKEIAGGAWWTVIHNMTAQYPQNPTDLDKRRIKNFLNYLINNFVCPDCVNHAKEYMSTHKIDYSSRNELSKYFCEMHNHVNLKTGKPVVDCSNILDMSVLHDNNTCTTCSLKSGGIKDNLEDFKKTIRNTVLSICKEEGVAPPNIHFQPCPDATSTSCIKYDHNRMKDGVYFGEADVYINPYSASLRTAIHETKHYVDLKKGNDLSEVPTDNYAIDKINMHFNFDSYKNEVASNDKLTNMDEQTLVTKDNNNNEISLIPIKNDVFASNKREVKFDHLDGLKTYYDYPSLHRINSLYEKPQVFRAKEDVGAAEGEVHKNIFVPENNDDFILSGLNGIFSWPASLVGVSPSSMSMTYVGSLVTNVMMYLIRSNMSTFGTSIFSLFASVSLFTGAAVFKNSIGQGDRGFIQGIVSMFLSAGINNLVPQKREVMGEGLRLFIEGIKTFDLGKIKESIFFDDEAFTINKTIKPAPSGKGLSNNDKVANALLGLSADVNPNRQLQLGARREYDMKNYGMPSALGSGDKNTVPNYMNSDLKGVAGSYERKRMLLQNAAPSLNNLNNIDINDLANELQSGIADLDLDQDTYEILQM